MESRFQSIVETFAVRVSDAAVGHLGQYRVQCVDEIAVELERGIDLPIDELEIATESLQQLRFPLEFLPGFLPRTGLQAEIDTDDDDQQIEEDREPVLAADVLCYAP